ncbi:ATP-dependent DNA ligase [Candidatus Woesearchaeota archaeon]|nr:ATP-dependent DNA ligase [Candidatus Woesearchaeota archaeon]
MDYSTLAEVYERLESTSKRLEKTHILSEFLKGSDDQLQNLMVLVQGKVFPAWDSRELGIAQKLLVKAISKATGASLDQIESLWRELGDIGEVAEQLTKTKSQVTLFSQKLSVDKVFSNLRKLSSLEGQGTMDRKTALVAELLTSASPREAKYIIRTIVGALRVGLGQGTVRDAIVWAFTDAISYDQEKNDIILEDRETYNRYVEAVQEAFDVANDFGLVAKTAREQGIEGLRMIPLTVHKPVNVMLFQKAKSMAEAFERVKAPAAVEFKYDGFRLQIHKEKDRVQLFTRRLDNVTAQFPDVVDCVKKYVLADSCILDAEAVGYKGGKYLPFQNISQRIKRKYDIHRLAKDFPVEINVFDILYVNGESLLKMPFSERREILEANIKSVPFEFRPSEKIITDDPSVAQKFYEESLASGNEGIMMKNLEGIYKPGSRVGFGVKVKPVMETLDVVIVGAEWGEGKRGQWLSSFIVAVRDGDQFVEIGKVGTGIKEKAEEGTSFGELTELLQPLIIKKDGKEVRVTPSIVIEVNYEEIQASPTYSSGFALRFPRFVRLRDDRSAESISTLAELKQFYKDQRGRNA